MNFYNENDPYAAQWLRNLIKAGVLPKGVVDERSIEDIPSRDLIGYTQCHFFAGIGGWPLALAIAGVSPDEPLWTGSCPCQPFSKAGKGAGLDDERNLWPAWQWHIQQLRPARIYGEQVADLSAEPWIDLVSSDLEGLGYAFGALAFPSASVGAPHIRDRTYWLGDADPTRLEGYRRGLEAARQRNAAVRPITETGKFSDPQPTNGFWRAADWLACRDNRWRPVEPGTFPLATGLSGRVGRLRAYGNAINVYQAAEFIKAVMA